MAANAGQLFNAGDTVMPIGAGGHINAAGPVTEIINGIAFQAFLSGSFQVTAQPFVAPPQNGQSQFSFTTPFTMDGQISGSADPMGQVPPPRLSQRRAYCSQQPSPAGWLLRSRRKRP